MPTLFEAQIQRPLADRLRPTCLGDVVGQDHLLAPNAPIGRMVEAHRLASMVLWGPPGCGKTTIARLLADRTDLAFEPLSAVFSGVADLRKVFEAAKHRRALGQGTLLFVDEIHRFNRAQQDSFLPYVEDGTIVLVGATTENPSFELNGALLSRAQVFVLKRLDFLSLERLIGRAELLLGRTLPLDESGRQALVAMADGDGRYLLNMIEEVAALPADTAPLDTARLAALIQRRAPLYDKAQDSHYNLISALHKSLRGSDPDAALYWLARMLVGGEDPLYVVRRLVRFASEDIGLADPQALIQALAAWDAYERLGSPEGELAIAQAVAYLGTAPKSVALYRALGSATEAAKRTGSLTPPMHSLNAPTRLMKAQGYGGGYQYDPDSEDGFSGQNYFPDGMPRERFYEPVERGFEREIRKRLEYWDRLRREGQAGMSGVQSIEIREEDADIRLDRWFRRHFPGLNHVQLEKLLRTGQVRVDGGRVKAAHRLVAGMVVRVPPLDDRAAATQEERAHQQRAALPRPMTPREIGALKALVLYRDAEVIAINKPHDLAVQGGTNLVQHLDGRLDALKFDATERPRLVHRLDKDTSGVLLLARSAKAAAWLAAAFRDKTAIKTYWAVVAGVPRPHQGRIDMPVAKAQVGSREKMAVDDEEGRPAVTYYTVIEQAAQKAAWLALLPVTGRTHQLRVHCAELGTPILGDGKYGGAGAVLAGLEQGRKLHLHARSITLKRPDGKTLSITAPLPPHMEATWGFFGFAADTAGNPFAELDLG